MAPGGPMEVALEAKAAGRIGHIGVTSHSLDMAEELIQSGHFETIMFPFNFITREPAERLLPLCAKHDVGFISMKPMGGGLLESAELSFKWLKQHPLALPLVGIQSFAEIEEIVAVMADPAPLSAAQAAAIEAKRAELGTRFCRSCDYCQPCPQGIQISSVLRARSNVKRFHPDRFWGAATEKMIATAESCKECGECETRCPYELPIREMLKENTAWYRAQQALRAG
jgi:predicted aldo/keto reductase-like oxidoreductase